MRVQTAVLAPRARSLGPPPGPDRFVLAGGVVKTPDGGCVKGSGRCPAQRYRAGFRREFEVGHRDHRSDRSERDRVDREDRTTALTPTTVCRQTANRHAAL